MKIKKAVKISIIVVAILIVALIGAVIAFLMKQYNDVYVPIDFVEKTGTYVMPEYPDIEYGTETDTEEVTVDTVITSEPLDTGSPGTESVDSETQVINDPSSPEPEKITPDDSKNTASSSTTVKKDVNIYGGVPIEKVEQKDKDILNILLVGQDLRFDSGKRGRSDTMLVVSYNKKTGEIKMISFLRDSLVPIENHGWNRLNTAYAFGGIGLTLNTINNLFDLDIQNFVVIDLLGFIRGINYIGGLDIMISADEAKYYNSVYGYDWHEGICHLDGVMVKDYIRSRKIDSDFGRTKRQREVIQAVIDKVLNEMSIKEILDLIEYGSSLVKTNIDIMTMLTIASNALSQKDKLSIETQTVPFSDSYKYAYYNKMAIISFDIEDASKRINAFLYN